MFRGLRQCLILDWIPNGASNAGIDGIAKLNIIVRVKKGLKRGTLYSLQSELLRYIYL